jgi:RNA polymerase sigma factor (sigma-70 family)
MPVLLVDDDFATVTGFSELLSLENICASIATDAESAEAMVGETFYRVIVADIRLHDDDDGLRLIERIHEISPRSSVAAMTGHATLDVEQRLFNLGAPPLLRKPFGFDVFLSTIRGLREDADTAVYRDTSPRLRSMMKRRYRIPADDCDDILQEAWCVALQRRSEVRDMGAFLSGTVSNLSRQAIHRYIRERPVDAVPEERGYLPDDYVAIAVHTALASLDERSRTLCELIGFEQLTYGEVAQRLALPMGSIGPLYMRAKERLKRALAA